MEITELGNEIISHIMELYPDSRLYSLTSSDHHSIQRLVREKYSTWEWNYGYSPDYMFERKVVVSGYEISIFLQVKKGIITQASLSGDIFQELSGKKLESMLIQQRHDENVIFDILNRSKLNNYFHQDDIKMIAKSFF
jgi:lipoate-protein ligase A